MPLQKEQKKYTYQDYLVWPDNERWELIDGIPYNMTPAPITSHQKAAGRFYHLLESLLNHEKCSPFIAPTDVVLSESDIVQPDVLVVCDPQKITRENIQGAPDLIVEVLSPSTEKKDRWDKKRLYEKHGVREYILINVELRFLERYILRENGKYDSGEIFSDMDALKLHSLNNVEIQLNEIYKGIIQ